MTTNIVSKFHQNPSRSVKWFLYNSLHIYRELLLKSKNTLRVKINQLCDGKRDTMRNSYAIDKMWGFKLTNTLLKK